jgi:hypothetical protein
LNRFINGERGISLEAAAKLRQYLDLDWLHVVGGVGVGSNVGCQSSPLPEHPAYPSHTRWAVLRTG